MKQLELITLTIPVPEVVDDAFQEEFYVPFRREDFSKQSEFKNRVLSGDHKTTVPIMENIKEFIDLIDVLFDGTGICKCERHGATFGIVHYSGEIEYEDFRTIEGFLMANHIPDSAIPIGNSFVRRLPLIRALLQIQAPSLLPPFLLAVDKTFLRPRANP